MGFILKEPKIECLKEFATLIEVNTFRIEKTKVNNVPHIVAVLSFDYSDENREILVNHGYRGNLNHLNGIVQLPISMPIYVEEYKQTDEYFDELVTNIRNIIIDPVYAVLQSENDDLRLKGISELFLTLFDTKNSIEIESDFGKNQ